MRLIKRKKVVHPEYNAGFLNTFFSTGFYTGFFPVASGTFGSAAALLFFFIPSFSDIYILSSAIVLSVIIGILASPRMMRKYGNDPSVIVLDEFAGMWLTILIAGHYYSGILMYVVGFFMFRLFDIAKIYPASFFDKMKNGFGIMMDDIVAGIYGGVSTIIILKVIDFIK